MATLVHLDTNFLIYFVGGGNEEVIENVERWLREGAAIHVSAMAWAEFQCGPLLPEEKASAINLLRSILPTTGDIAVEAGRLFHETGRRSRSLADCLIAATAIRDQAELATVNRPDFEPMVPHGLRLL